MGLAAKGRAEAVLLTTRMYLYCSSLKEVLLSLVCNIGAEIGATEGYSSPTSMTTSSALAEAYRMPYLGFPINRLELIPVRLSP
jgi:hypothetical protein